MLKLFSVMCMFRVCSWVSRLMVWWLFFSSVDLVSLIFRCLVVRLLCFSVFSMCSLMGLCLNCRVDMLIVMCSLLG